MSNLWGRRGDKLANYLKMQGGVGSSVNAFFLGGVLAGPSKVYIWALVATVILVIEECVHKLYSAAVSIALVYSASLII